MGRAARRRRRILIALLCCLPTFLLATAWGVGTFTALLRPPRALPERTVAGVEDGGLHFYTASGAVPFEDLPPASRPVPGAQGAPWGRQVIESRRARAFGLDRGVEWHGTFATYFDRVTIPMWLLLLCTTPLLAVAGWHVYRVVASARAHREGLCPKCGCRVSDSMGRCPECGRALPSVDPVSQVFLAGGPPAEARKSE